MLLHWAISILHVITYIYIFIYQISPNHLLYALNCGRLGDIVMKCFLPTWCLLSVREYQQLNRAIIKLHVTKMSLERMQWEIEGTTDLALKELGSFSQKIWHVIQNLKNKSFPGRRNTGARSQKQQRMLCNRTESWSERMTES